MLEKAVHDRRLRGSICLESFGVLRSASVVTAWADAGALPVSSYALCGVE
jgi:hypothetical protein